MVSNKDPYFKPKCASGLLLLIENMLATEAVGLPTDLWLQSKLLTHRHTSRFFFAVCLVFAAAWVDWSTYCTSTSLLESGSGNTSGAMSNPTCLPLLCPSFCLMLLLWDLISVSGWLCMKPSALVPLVALLAMYIELLGQSHSDFSLLFSFSHWASLAWPSMIVNKFRVQHVVAVHGSCSQLALWGWSLPVESSGVVADFRPCILLCLAASTSFAWHWTVTFCFK